MIDAFLDELLDLYDAQAELTRRRGAVERELLDAMDARDLREASSPRGAARVRRRLVLDAVPSRVLLVLEREGWVDDALRVDGAALHKLARGRPAVLADLRVLGVERLERELVVRRLGRQLTGTRRPSASLRRAAGTPSATRSGRGPSG